MSLQTSPLSTGSLKAGDTSLPLTKMEVTGAITALLHRTKVCQTFINDHQVPLEAVYTHPLPPKASVHGFRLVIGGRVVEGVVQERAAARQAYAQAVSQGHRAALMEEERSDIFTTTVGNIAPGEQVSISFELSGPLEFLETTASLRFPLVVPEVYISGTPLAGENVGDGTAHDTDSVPDASRITPPRLAEGATNPVDLRLSFSVDPAGLELEKVDSLCHFAKTRRQDDGTFLISLLPGIERLDRDFVVRLKLKEGTLQSTLVQDAESGVFALTVVPPLSTASLASPRDLVIVMDRSGSMSGWSMTAARRAATRIVESLTPDDRFAVLAFDDRIEMFEPHLVACDFRQQQRAAEFLSQIEARGGTEARPAIEQALQMLKGSDSRNGAERTVLFITDGDVGNDAELVVRSFSGVRVSTVGIGQNLRAGVLESMAKVSGGLCTLISEESSLEEALHNLHQRLGRPHWMGLSLLGIEVEGMAPRFWDVWEGVPVTFFGKAPKLDSEVTVEGRLVSAGQQSQKVTVRHRDDLVLHRSWARARLLDLDDLWTIGKAEQQELVELSVEAQVLCRFTAFAAIDLSDTVDNSQERKVVVQPVEPTLKKDVLPSHRGSSRAKPAPLSGAPAAGGFSPRAPRRMEMAPPPPPAPSPAYFSDEELCDAYETEAPPCPEPQAKPASLGRIVGGLREKLSSALFGQNPEPQSRNKAASQENSVWSVLLELLERFETAEPSQKGPLLAKMVELLAAHCRQFPTGSAQQARGQETMSRLIDLQQAWESSENLQPLVLELRQALRADIGEE